MKLILVARRKFCGEVARLQNGRTVTESAFAKDLPGNTLGTNMDSQEICNRICTGPQHCGNDHSCNTLGAKTDYQEVRNPLRAAIFKIAGSATPATSHVPFSPSTAR